MRTVYAQPSGKFTLLFKNEKTPAASSIGAQGLVLIVVVYDYSAGVITAPLMGNAVNNTGVSSASVASMLCTLN